MGELFWDRGRSVVLSIGFFIFSVAIGWSIAQTTLRTVSFDRVPASTDEADYDPELYANDSIRDLELEYRRQNPSKKKIVAKRQARKDSTENIWFDVVSSSDSSSITKDAEEKTGIPVRRARKVIINTSRFLLEKNEQWIEIEPFQDCKLLLRLQKPSVYGVNHAILVGQVVGDPGSQVRITIEGSLVSAFIRTKRLYLRIVSAGSHSHFIIEVDESRIESRNK